MNHIRFLSLIYIYIHNLVFALPIVQSLIGPNKSIFDPLKNKNFGPMKNFLIIVKFKILPKIKTPKTIPLTPENFLGSLSNPGQNEEMELNSQRHS